MGYVSLASYRSGDINLYHGVPFLCREGQKWITFRQSSSAPHWLWQNNEPPRSQQSGTDNSVGYAKPTLPDRETLLVYLHQFNDSEFGYVFPIVDLVLFQETLQYTYDPSGDEDAYVVTTAQACVHAFLALRPLGDIGDGKLPSVDSEHCVTAVQLLLPNVLGRRASTQEVDALIMLVSR